MTSIQDLVEKIKDLGVRYRPNLRIIPDDLFLGLIIILVAFGSFGLGRLSKIEGAKTPIRFENKPEITSSTFVSLSSTVAPVVVSQIPQSGDSASQLVGSKNGTKYYYPWCTGVSKISPENLIYFTSKTEAETRGYTASATCKGL